MRRTGVCIVIATILTVALALPLFATGSQEGGGKEIIFNVSSETNGYDPRSSVGLDQQMVIQQTFEGLVRFNENGAIVPGQAESWEVLDGGARYVFHLRDDIYWSDGEPVTAGDFVYAWRSALDPEFASTSANLLYPMKNAQAILEEGADDTTLGARAIDDRTLEVELESANPFFLSELTHGTWFPVREDVAGENPDGWTLTAETMIGNGPFEMVEWNTGEYIDFVPNEDYYDVDKINIDRLRFVFITEATTSLAALRAGDIHVTELLPPAEIPSILDDGWGVVTPLIAPYYYSINMGEDADEEVREGLWDRRVRHALNLAIDRTAITDDVLQGGQVPAYGFAPEGIIGPDGKDFRKQKRYFDPEGNVEQAQRLMAEAGFPNGEGFPTYEIFYNTSEMHASVAQAVQEMWRQNLGINVELVNKETRVFAEERAAGQFQITRSGNLSQSAYPSVLGLFTRDQLDSTNDPKWINDEYISLIREAQNGTDPERIFELYHQAEDILMEEMPVIPVFYYTRILAKRPEVSGLYKPSNAVVYFDRADISEE
jgi:oligopeptide transport system substrate-binding protein